MDGAPGGFVHSADRLPFAVHDATALLTHADPAPRPPVTPEQVQACLFTSGTTGLPKCVIRTWDTFESSGQWLFPDDLPAADRAIPTDGAYYNPWPPFHGLALSGLAVAVQRGLRLVVRRGFSLSRFWPDIRALGCTHFVLLIVAPLILGLEPRPDDDNNPLHQVTMVPLVKNFAEFEERFGVRVGTMYGQSETGPILATAEPRDYRTAGRPVPGVEAKLIGPDGEPVQPGERGELVVRRPGATIPIGTYLRSPDDSPEQVLGDGWFRTGDAFRRNDRGEYQLVDRIKDYIRHRGHNLSSLELEHELLAHPSIVDCAFVGVHSDLADTGVVGDEDVKAVVVLQEGATLSAIEVVRFLESRVPGYMLPRYVDFVGALPRTATLKTRKVELRGGSRGTDVWQLGSR
jgi:crotonobetaine/carnitine-CoA ligase